MGWGGVGWIYSSHLFHILFKMGNTTSNEEFYQRFYYHPDDSMKFIDKEYAKVMKNISKLSHKNKDKNLDQKENWDKINFESSKSINTPYILIKDIKERKINLGIFGEFSRTDIYGSTMLYFFLSKFSDNDCRYTHLLKVVSRIVEIYEEFGFTHLVQFGDAQGQSVLDLCCQSKYSQMYDMIPKFTKYYSKIKATTLVKFIETAGGHPNRFALDALIEKSDLGIANSTGNNFLIYFVTTTRYPDVDIIKKFIDCGTPLDFKNCQGKNVLTIFCGLRYISNGYNFDREINKAGCIKLLLKSGAPCDPNILGVYFNANSSMLDNEIISTMIEKVGSIDQVIDQVIDSELGDHLHKQGDNALIHYIKFGTMDEKLVSKFIEYGSCINYRNTANNSFLMELIIKKYINIATLFIKDIKFSDQYDWTLINAHGHSILSIYVGHIECNQYDFEIFKFMFLKCKTDNPNSSQLNFIFKHLLDNFKPTSYCTGQILQHMVKNGYVISIDQKFRITTDLQLSRLCGILDIDPTPVV